MKSRPGCPAVLATLTSVMFLPGLPEAPASEADVSVTLQANALRIGLDATGQVRSLYDAGHQREYLAATQPAPLLSMDLGSRIESPSRLTVSENGRKLELTYPACGIAATVVVEIHATHAALELVQLSGTTPEKVRWGPYPTTIGKTVGEVVGVVRDDQFALGIQGLNLKTSAGAASATFGSTLHARTQDRTRERIISVGEVKDFRAPAMQGPDAALTGSRIALFGCPEKQALETIGRIEVAEGLPHPVLEGAWAKTSPDATRSYLITPFDERSLDEVLDVAGRAGLKYIYHMDPFRSWGHFEISQKGFPQGIESLRRCVERARTAGIRVGVHTLSNFIHPHDPYVSPVPDPRLMRTGTSRLTAPLDETSTTVPIADPVPFRNRQWLSTAVVGEELIRYTAVSEQEPWLLTGCQRGAFKTRAAAHPAGAEIGKLWDHPYQVFFPNLELQDEITARLVQLFNQTGLRQISFDGLEGCLATGQGEYAEARFVKACYDGWPSDVISDSSQLLHFTWHIHTRMNWGEPWGKAMREGMPEYRLKNQEFFRRNLLPPMLGWFQIQSASAELEATNLDDVEWVLARCAGFDAGCAWVTSPSVLKRIGQADAILAAIRMWDQARHSKLFSNAQKSRMQDPGSDFHLEQPADGQWRLTPVSYSSRLEYRPAAEADGAVTEASWEVNNRFADQPLQFLLRVTSKAGNPASNAVSNPTFELNGQRLTFPVRLEPGEYLVGGGGTTATVCDADWNPQRTVQADSVVPALPAGPQQIKFRCEAQAGAACLVTVRVKTVGAAEPVGGS